MRAVIPALVAGVVVGVALVLAAGFSVLVGYVLGIGLSTFIVYSYDKRQSIRNGRRVPERALLLLSVIGGALGGWAGMLVWRHKTQHAIFWVAQVIGTVVIAAALWLV